MQATFTMRLCFWHPWRMRRRLWHPVELGRTFLRERELGRWERKHGHPYFEVPEWALPKPIPDGWWSLYRCLQKTCDGLFYLGENAHLIGPFEAPKCGYDPPRGWSWCPECGCSSGAGVAQSKVRCGPPLDPAFIARSDQDAAEDRERSKWVRDGDRKILGVF